MKTAVEWLETRAEEREKNNPNESAYWHLRELIKDFEQAKEMEKEYIKKGWLQDRDITFGDWQQEFEQWYSQEFKQQEQ